MKDWFPQHKKLPHEDESSNSEDQVIYKDVLILNATACDTVTDPCFVQRPRDFGLLISILCSL